MLTRISTFTQQKDKIWTLNVHDNIYCMYFVLTIFMILLVFSNILLFVCLILEHCIDINIVFLFGFSFKLVGIILICFWFEFSFQTQLKDVLFLLILIAYHALSLSLFQCKRGTHRSQTIHSALEFFFGLFRKIKQNINRSNRCPNPISNDCKGLFFYLCSKNPAQFDIVLQILPWTAYRKRNRDQHGTL